MDKQCLNSMKARIIITIGNQIPLLPASSHLGLFHETVSFFKLKPNNNLSIFII